MVFFKYVQNFGRQKFLSEFDSQGLDSVEKEYKIVTFNDDYQVQETSLMFFRCSFLGFLSSFDVYLVYSFVISDYSRRVSEVVLLSELFDFFSEIMSLSLLKSLD